MSLLDPIDTEATSPDAWQRIEADIAEMKRATAGTFLPLVAEVLSENGADVLYVVALTDYIGPGDEGYPATVSFQGRLDGE